MRPAREWVPPAEETFGLELLFVYGFGTIAGVIIGFACGLPIEWIAVVIVANVILFGSVVDWLAAAALRPPEHVRLAVWAARASALLVPVLVVLVIVAWQSSLPWLVVAISAALVLGDGWFVAHSGSPWQGQLRDLGRNFVIVCGVVVVSLFIIRYA